MEAKVTGQWYYGQFYSVYANPIKVETVGDTLCDSDTGYVLGVTDKAGGAGYIGWT